ncbi:uncharacterized protein A4U43_C05F1720 [Asparagus officinalis]|uniref:RNA-polymerase II-associated protein 3-like C-terminal domain-containing protein n=2 Tax=Asparagus officinalis TaxID=4686 RepID=A0A5P1ENL0_ASPOF|nr:uncharacterized protein A4U43_C05F1720 [Asparagus officinalis]
MIPPATLPKIFKNALSAPMLIEIIKCTAAIFKEDTEFAVSILDNLTKVPRFDMIIMCLSAVDHAEIHHQWEQVFSMKDIRADHVDVLNKLRPKFCYGQWQAHVLGSNGRPK